VSDIGLNVTFCRSYIETFISPLVERSAAAVYVPYVPHKECWLGFHLLHLGLESVTHVASATFRPTVTFPAGGHHCPVAGTKLYCLAKEARRRECHEDATRKYALTITPQDYTGALLEGARYCDQHVRPYRYVCLSASISQKPHVKISPNFYFASTW